MIELIQGLPDEVVAFEAVGEVTAADYRGVVRPAVERALAAHSKICLLHVLGDRFEGQSAPALWDDAELGLHAGSYERIAVVSDLEPIRALAKTVEVALPIDLRLFSNADREDAIAWICAGAENGA